MLSYLTKCTVVRCRKGAIIWKEHIFALGKQRTMNCSESHPSLKDNIHSFISVLQTFHGSLLRKRSYGFVTYIGMYDARAKTNVEE